MVYWGGETLFKEKWIFIVFFCLVSLTSAMAVQNSKEIYKERLTAERVEQIVNKQIKDKLSVVCHFTYRPECFSPFSNIYIPYNYYCLGWVSGLPFNKRKLMEVTGERDPRKLNAFSKSKNLQWIFNDKSIFSQKAIKDVLGKKYQLGENFDV